MNYFKVDQNGICFPVEDDINNYIDKTHFHTDQIHGHYLSSISKRNLICFITNNKRIKDNSILYNAIIEVNSDMDHLELYKNLVILYNSVFDTRYMTLFNMFLNFNSKQEYAKWKLSV